MEEEEELKEVALEEEEEEARAFQAAFQVAFQEEAEDLAVVARASISRAAFPLEVEALLAEALAVKAEDIR